MLYLTKVTEILGAIDELASYPILWLDTEIADWQTPYPRISLIQVSVDVEDLTGEKVLILDVLDQPQLVNYFIERLMVNPEIEKVFHNSSFDLKYLGEYQAQNITCTYKLAKKITRDRLLTTNLKLKTLAIELCHFSNVDAEEGTSNWGQRPLTQKQLDYAKMDTVYLARVHLYLRKWNGLY